MRKWQFAVVAALGAAVIGISWVGGETLAKWSDAYARDGVKTDYVAPTVELAASQNGDWTTIDTVAQNDFTLGVPFGADEAAEMRALSEASLAADGTVIWTKAFRLSGTTQGTMGYGYTVKQPTTAAGGYAEDLVLVEVGSPAACTAAALAQNWGDFPGQAAGSVDGNGLVTALSRPDAVGASYGTDKQDTRYFCLAAKYSPKQIENTATATASAGANGTASATDSWSAFVYADPVKEASVQFEVAVKFFGPS
ncbi:MAG: hypothetical protein LBD97_03405 [Bifidobacteriaceae bacterium]|jgi:hypothetical protein|nr:hypothetical protein [Bifidobacteriaceae bacterium]